MCFRSQARACESSFSLLYTYVYISVYSRPSFISRLRIKPPISTLVGASWTFRSYFRDTALRISQSQLYAPFRAFLCSYSVLCFRRSSRATQPSPLLATRRTNVLEKLTKIHGQRACRVKKDRKRSRCPRAIERVATGNGSQCRLNRRRFTWTLVLAARRKVPKASSRGVNTSGMRVYTRLQPVDFDQCRGQIESRPSVCEVSK